MSQQRRKDQRFRQQWLAKKAVVYHNDLRNGQVKTVKPLELEDWGSQCERCERWTGTIRYCCGLWVCADCEWLSKVLGQYAAEQWAKAKIGNFLEVME